MSVHQQLIKLNWLDPCMQLRILLKICEIVSCRNVSFCFIFLDWRTRRILPVYLVLFLNRCTHTAVLPFSEFLSVRARTSFWEGGGVWSEILYLGHRGDSSHCFRIWNNNNNHEFYLQLGFLDPKRPLRFILKQSHPVCLMTLKKGQAQQMLTTSALLKHVQTGLWNPSWLQSMCGVVSCGQVWQLLKRCDFHPAVCLLTIRVFKVNSFDPELSLIHRLKGCLDQISLRSVPKGSKCKTE